MFTTLVFRASSHPSSLPSCESRFGSIGGKFACVILMLLSVPFGCLSRALRYPIGAPRRVSSGCPFASLGTQSSPKSVAISRMPRNMDLSLLVVEDGASGFSALW
ncbi:hypothetical protein BDV98DRAFT_577491 [Pterulicium gracile]|uniref:Uncharacterized protein n=1 Tax=Pterulicium gracile TaxID=1884261 RepID=A0A5C3Q5Z5_9AGAR|nr:hypothetical protein BDV98DRAFT_577491 [Pterula gracilis]